MKKRGLTLLLFVLLGLTACGESAQTQQVMQKESDGKMEQQWQTIDAAQGKKMMDEQTVTVVDVRTAEEYAGGHVPAAVNVANEDIGTEPPAALTDKDAALLVYCRSGRRSRDAVKKLAEMGYTNLYDMGGIIDWPYETVTEEADA